MKRYKDNTYYFNNMMFRPTYFLMKSFIQNIEYPFCVNCIHFLDHIGEYPYTRVNNINGRCKIFGKANLITGLIKYESAIDCRHDDDKCGIEGQEYERRTND